MRQSELFTKTRREAPKDEVSKNAGLLIRAGYIHKEMAGAYSFLPLGLRVLDKIMGIIREEMNAIGGQEIHLTALQDPEPWQKSGRWADDAIDVWFKTKLKNGTEVGLGSTHEEPLTRLMKQHITSYKDLPLYVYQIQTKFRNELRAKSGLMRVREFKMKDLYSFSADTSGHETFYERSKVAYKNIFDRVGLGERTYITFASGGSFSKYSHEFQTVSDAGEDTVYIDEKKKIAVNKEVYTEKVLDDLKLKKEELTEIKSIEVGNIFSLGTRFSLALGLMYKDETGTDKPVVMGSYGIGPERLMGTVVEVLSDEKGIVWPESVAPFRVHLIDLSQGNDKIREYAEELYTMLEEQGVEVLYDDRSVRAGEKFADSDLLGIPYRAVISERTMTEGKIEIIERASGITRMVSEAQFHTI